MSPPRERSKVEKDGKCEICKKPDKDGILCGCERCARLFCQGCNSVMTDLCVECG